LEMPLISDKGAKIKQKKKVGDEFLSQEAN
jgi:hypothetical protein